ncbi:MAG: hemolysin family protein, partial [Oscillospiraceae bacterium]
LVVTVLIIVFGEVIPKSFANTRSESVCKFTSFPLSIFKTIMTPVVFLLEKLKKLVIPTNKNPDPSVTEDELKVIIDEIGDEGIIEEDQTELLQSALGFADTTVDEILTPRVDIFALPTDATHEEIVNTFVEQRFSRLPVFDKTIDDIVGVVNQKDYFSKVIMGNIPPLSEVTQNCLYVPPKKKINELMGELQRKRLHLAVVTDPHGGTLGIVTLEDILEELVGEIWDEHDEITYMVLPLGDGRFEINGELLVEELFETLDEPLKTDDFDAITVAGLALEQLGKIPTVGETFSFQNYNFTVSKVDDNRIVKLQIEKINTDTKTEDK